MEIQEAKNYQIDRKFEVQLERSATKGVDGFKITAHGDDRNQVVLNAINMKLAIETLMTPIPAPAPEKEGK